MNVSVCVDAMEIHKLTLDKMSTDILYLIRNVTNLSLFCSNFACGFFYIVYLIKMIH